MSTIETSNNSLQPNKTKSWAVSIATLMLFAMVMTFAIYEGTKNTVTVVVNGEEEEVRTHAKTVGEFLAEQEYHVAEHDFLSHPTEAAIEGDVAIEWEEAKQYTVDVDGQAVAAWTTDNTVAGVLEKAEISLTEFDKVSPALEEQVDADTAISVEKAYEVTILDGSEEKKAWSTSTTVADFLNQQNISLGEFDRVERKMEELVLPNSEIKVVRVEKVTDVVEDSVKFAVETKKDS
ncbi:MAG TPA: ubiquitin-like domain-containing protein, partial [Planococcus sp. (in: firmicutes)]|nr:ubiquitin-like domain-containing protein [Planococcus sp. (in: firmicutes)]